jgi:hypothetical protein
VIQILPPRPPEGRGIGGRLIRSLPDLGLGALFAAARRDLFGLGARHGVRLMLLVEIEGWILVVTLLSGALAYAVTTEQEWQERAKSLVGLVLVRVLPPVYFAFRWQVWRPIAA